MKRTISALMIFTLLLTGCAAAGAEGDALVYASDFSAGPDGWYGRRATCTVTGDGALHTEGRTADWNSPGRDFDLIEGGKYRFSVEVRQDTLDSAAFMVSVAHTKDGTESYENLAHGTGKQGEWVTLEGTYTAGDFQRFVLYVETTGASDLAFDIRNFRLEAPEGLPEAKATEPPMVIEAAENLPSLKEIWADSFDFGTCAPQFLFMNPKMKELVLQQFNILTPENELKPDSVLDVAESKRLSAEDETAAAVHFDAARPLLDFAKENGLKVHGHVLVWHSQTPEAFFHESYDPSKPLVTREVMLGRLENYIRGVMEYMAENYPGVVVSWDVVNEAIDDGTNTLRKSRWLEVVGDDFVARAFELARKYAPEGTLLYYNDYNTAVSGKRIGIKKLLVALMEEGNIDGYGFQMHHSTGFPTMEAIRASVEDIGGLGLKLRVSELDVGVDNNSEASFLKQASFYARLMKLLRSHSDWFEAVQVWGVTDAMSWRAQNYPLLFDGAGNPKPAFYAVADPDSVE